MTCDVLRDAGQGKACHPADCQACAQPADQHHVGDPLAVLLDQPAIKQLAHEPRAQEHGEHQRQRLNLARALLARPDILCLDDATSALDAISERRVLDNIRQLPHSHGRVTTLLVISSKLSTILLADRVLMLEGGHIADSGRHEELLQRNPYYRDLLGIEHG